MQATTHVLEPSQWNQTQVEHDHFKLQHEYENKIIHGSKHSRNKTVDRAQQHSCEQKKADHGDQYEVQTTTSF